MVRMEIGSIFLNACITILSLGLFLLSLASYRKYKNLRLIFTTVAFFVFFMKGIVLSLGLFYEEMAVVNVSIYLGLFDVAILALLFIATLKR